MTPRRTDPAMRAALDALRCPPPRDEALAQAVDDVAAQAANLRLAVARTRVRRPGLHAGHRAVALRVLAVVAEALDGARAWLDGEREGG